MYFTKEYITGVPLNLKKYTLGYLKQPIVDNFMYDYDFIDFIRPYYVGMMLSYEDIVKKEKIAFSYFLSAMKKEAKIMNSFYKGLTILYETTIDDLTFFNDSDNRIVLKISKIDTDGELKPVSFISDENFITLCEVVLEMCIFDKPKEEGELQGDPEKVRRFKEQQRKYFANKKNDENILFENIVRELMYLQNIHSYEDIKSMTIWRLRDAHKVETMIQAEDREWLLASGGKYKVKQIKSWQKQTKLKK